MITNSRRSAGPFTTAPTSPPIVAEPPRRAASTSKLGALLRGDSTPEAKLHEALSELAITTKLTMKAAECQRRGAAKLAEWARDTKNFAIDDVVTKTNEIMQMHGDRLLELALQSEKHLGHMRYMNDCDKKVSEAEKLVRTLMDKKRKLEKENSRRPSTASELHELHRQLDHAARELKCQHGEREIVRMLQCRKLLKGISDAYMKYTAVTAALFGCQGEIAEFMPALSNPGHEVFHMRYDGGPFTQERVDRLKHLVRSFDSADDAAKMCAHHQTSQLLSAPRRRSEPARRAARPVSQHAPASPPPPYTPTAPPPSETERGSVANTNSSSSLTSSTSSNGLSTSVASSRPSHLQPIQPSATIVTTTPTSRANVTTSSSRQDPNSSLLQPIPPIEHPSALAQLATPSNSSAVSGRDRRKENRRSMPACTGCTNRLYPELPPNPYRSTTTTSSSRDK